MLKPPRCPFLGLFLSTLCAIVVLSCFCYLSAEAADLIIDGTVHVCTADEEHGSSVDVWILNGGELHTGDYSQTFGHVVVNASSYFYGNDSAIIGTESFFVQTNSIPTNGIRLNSGEFFVNGYFTYGSTYSFRVDDVDCLDANSGTVSINISSGGYFDLSNNYLNNLNMNDSASWVHELNLNGNLYVGSVTFQSYGGSEGITVDGDCIVDGIFKHSNYDNSFGSLTVAATGTVTLSSGTTYITDKDASNLGFNLNTGGVLDASNGILESQSSGKLKTTGTGNLYDVIINSGTITQFFTHITIDNNLVIQSGSTFQRNSAGNTLTVLGDTVVNGTLGNSPWTGTFTTNSLTIDGGTYEATSGNTTVGPASTGGWIWYNDGTYNNNGGDVHIFTSAAWGPFTQFGGDSFHNLYIEDCGGTGKIKHTVDTLFVDNDMVIQTNAIFETRTSIVVDITGGWVINGTQSANSGEASGSWSAGSILIYGTLEATSGTLTVTGTGDAWKHLAGGTFTHNDGTVELSGNDARLYEHGIESTFYTLKASGTYIIPDVDVTVENLLDVTGGLRQLESGVTITLGDGAGNAGEFRISNGKRYRISVDLSIYGADASNPAIVDNNGDNYALEWSDGSHTKNLKWLDFTGPMVTGGSATLQLDGPCSFNDFQVDTGATFNQNGHHLTINGLFSTPGTYTIGAGGGLSIESSGNYTMSQDCTYDTVWLSGDLLMGGYNLTVDYIKVNATGNMWAESGDLTVGDTSAENSYNLDVWGDFYGGNGTHTIECMYIAEGSNYQFTSELSDFIGRNANSYMAIAWRSNTIDHNHGTVSFSTTTVGTQRLYSQDAAYTLTLWDVIANCASGKNLESYTSTNLYSMVHIENNFVVQSDATYRVFVGTWDEGKYAWDVDGDVIVNGTVDFYNGEASADHSFGSLTINPTGDVTLTNGTTSITSENDDGYGCVFDGILDANEGTLDIVGHVGSFSNIDITSTGNVYNLVISTDYVKQSGLNPAVTIDGDFTVSVGGNYQFGGTEFRHLTVTGHTTIYGVLQCGATAVDFTTSSLHVASGGTYEATSGETILTGKNGDNYKAQIVPGATLVHNNGAFNLTTAGGNGEIMCRDDSFYDVLVNINARWTYAVTIDNDLIINATFKDSTDNKDITIGGVVRINSGGMWGDGTESGDWSAGSVSIQNGGILSSTSATLQCGYFYNTNGGTFTHNNGEVEIVEPSAWIRAWEYTTFYDLTNSAGTVTIGESIAIENTMLTNPSTIFYPRQDNTILTFGTDSSSGYIVNNGGIRQSSNDYNIGFYAADESYPAIASGNDWGWSMRSGSLWQLKWITFQMAVDTSNDGSQDTDILLYGDCDFQSTLTVGSGDSFDLSGFRTDVTGAIVVEAGATYDLSRGTVICYDVMTFNGDWGDDGDQTDGIIQTANGLTVANLTVLDGTTLNLIDNPTVDATTVTINETASLEAPSGTLTSGDWLNYNGVAGFIHNEGVVIINDDIENTDTTTTFYELRLICTSVNVEVREDIIVEHRLVTDSAGISKVSFYTYFALGELNVGFGNTTTNASWYNADDNCQVEGRAGRNTKFYSVNADYPCYVYGKEVKWDEGVSNGNDTIFIMFENINFGVNINSDYGSSDLFTVFQLTGGTSFSDLQVDSGDTLDLNGHRAIFNGTLTMDGTLATGGSSAIELTENAAWDMDRNVTLAAFEVDGLLTVPEGITVEFTSSEGFVNSTGTIDITGSYGNLVYLTGVPYWKMNADDIEYFWKYVNITHGKNTGLSALVALGEGYDLVGIWDFQAPLITSHHVTEGLFVDTRFNDMLHLDWTAEDMSFLYGMNVTISDHTGSMIFSSEINASTFGETAGYRWNLSRSVDDLSYGTLVINYTATDAHNPPTSSKAKKNAESMLCDLAGELIGKPSGKEKSEKLETNTIKFKKAGPFVSDLFDIEFLVDVQGSQHVVKWTGDNFKMSHWVKLDHGTSIPMRISADSIEHITSPEFGAAHFLINGEYFYDAVDFEATGGKILLLDHGILDEKEYVTLSFTHPEWRKGGGWGLIDPLTGAINSRSETYTISLGTIPELVIPNNNSKLHGDLTSTLLKVRVYGAGTFEGTVSFYHESGVFIGSQDNITNDTVALAELTNLEKDTLYTWYAVFSVGGENFTSPSWRFLTGGLEPGSAPPGLGRERYGDSTSNTPDIQYLVFFMILITLIVFIMKIWYGGEVNKS